ncbi:hypothetical protein Z043_121557 [Scleropages formosus]|uniref:Uncharacterized protein n=1 Tax=Scleropages formosus TaxID=113540 RepID=A0A0P7Y467_SCLFO|nr:hypothetical protein Z043_121557 [Scleropages formosus]
MGPSGCVSGFAVHCGGCVILLLLTAPRNPRSPAKRSDLDPCPADWTELDTPDQRLLSDSSHSRKGRMKREASSDTNRPNPAGHLRKIAIKLRNGEKKGQA